MSIRTVLHEVIPRPTEIGREAIIVMCGALVAALVIGYAPGVREWIKAQWSGDKDAPPSATPWL